MKNLRLCLFVLLVVTLTESDLVAQVEQGDVNISASFTLNTVVGADDNFGFWSLQNQAGYYFTDNIEAGVILLFSGVTGEDSSTTPGYGLFGSYSFLTNNASLVPFAGAQFFSINPEGVDAITSAGINGGLKYFINENLFVNNRLDYGVILSPSEAEGGNLTLLIGLGFIF